MFYNASSFNQDIGNWDHVSNGEDFVSMVMNTNTAMHESNHVTHDLLMPFLVTFIHSMACLEEHCHLIKTLEIGMFPMVKTL